MTNFLLLIIALTLLFGAGAVLGFFSTVFWILVFVISVLLVIFFTKHTVKSQADEITKSYNKHPTYTVVLWGIIIVFFLCLILGALAQRSDNRSIPPVSNVTIPTSNSPQQFDEDTLAKIQKAKAAGFSDEQVLQKAAEYQAQKNNKNTKPLPSSPTPIPINKYPIANRTEFLSNCYKSGDGMISYCNCLLDYFEKNYSLDEFSKIETEYIKTQKYPQSLIEAVSYCIEKNN